MISSWFNNRLCAWSSYHAWANFECQNGDKHFDSIHWAEISIYNQIHPNQKLISKIDINEISVDFRIKWWGSKLKFKFFQNQFFRRSKFLTRSKFRSKSNLSRWSKFLSQSKFLSKSIFQTIEISHTIESSIIQTNFVFFSSLSLTKTFLETLNLRNITRWKKRRFSKEDVSHWNSNLYYGTIPEHSFSLCYHRANENGAIKQMMYRKVASRSNFHSASHACRAWR